MRRLQAQGLADPDVDVETVRAMLLSAMFGDAICRDMMEHVFPEPESEAAAKYVGIARSASTVRAHCTSRDRPPETDALA